MRKRPPKSKKKRPPKGSPLTPRELQVLKLLATGLRSHQIAKRLRITEPTVKSYRSTIMWRLDTRNIVKLLGKALKKKLIRSIG